MKKPYEIAREAIVKHSRECKNYRCKPDIYGRKIGLCEHGKLLEENHHTALILEYPGRRFS